jgi:hypothetical protein
LAVFAGESEAISQFAMIWKSEIAASRKTLLAMTPKEMFSSLLNGVPRPEIGNFLQDAL